MFSFFTAFASANAFKRSSLLQWSLLWLSFFASIRLQGQAPANDLCSNAIVVPMPNGGFDFGIFSSATVDLSQATVQIGETFAPAILVAGQNQKSVWFKFTLPTSRSIRVSLAQPGSAITAGDAGFAVYRSSNCTPAVGEISTKLTPLGVFGNTFHPCVDAGEYLVQVSGKAVANGPVYIQVESRATNAAYDNPTDAYDFGTLYNSSNAVIYSVDCQSLNDASEICTKLENAQDYSKSTWHVFKTGSYYDFISLLLAAQSNSIGKKYGYRLYKGDVRTSNPSSLTVVDGCDSLENKEGYTCKRAYRCGQLDINTTYSIQLLFKKDFNEQVNLTVAATGTVAAQGPQPIKSQIDASANKLGLLRYNSNYGETTLASDYMGCNARISEHPCEPSLPAKAIQANGTTYKLSNFFTFSLATSSKVVIYATSNTPFYGPQLYCRLFKQALTEDCKQLDTANVISQFQYYSGNLTCLPAGDYTLQVLGQDTMVPYWYYSFGSFNGNGGPIGLFNNLGNKIDLNINVTSLNSLNKYSLATKGAYDTINAQGGIMKPLEDGVRYTSQVDTFGCSNTVLPADTTCNPANQKAIYRQFLVADSGILNLTGNYWNQYSKIYKGDADALATAQIKRSFPERLTGLEAQSICLYNYYCGGVNLCVTPGSYTQASFGGQEVIGQSYQSSFTFKKLESKFGNPAAPENMGTLNPGTGTATITGVMDFFSCRDNAVTINGVKPCAINGSDATKAIYRQFYLAQPSTLSISGFHYTPDCGYTYGSGMVLYKGKISDGIGGLSVVGDPFKCFTNASSPTCGSLDAGWYTIVSYGTGPNYENPLKNLEYNGGGYSVGRSDVVSVTAYAACPKPQYNRPFKAAVDSITRQPFLLEWAPRAAHTNAYPKTDTTIILYGANFDCTNDTPFVNQHLPACGDANVTKTAYYVFKTTQESFVQINTKGLWGAVYQGDARTDSASFGPSTVIQTCVNQEGKIQICKLQPGTYTLVMFAPYYYSCNTISPTIYIDRLGESRFDHASNAYDFGELPPDSVYYFGKPGDINPLDPSRAPSNDFFYCTTGAQKDDPADAACMSEYTPSIYNNKQNNAYYDALNQAWYGNIPRRNLWYSFVIKGGGNVRVKVNSKTPGKLSQYPFTIYKSNADGSLPLSVLKSNGQIDSTIAQGLSFIARNLYYYCWGYNEIGFYREPCNAMPERYFVMVENKNGYGYDPVHFMDPNSQLEVAVLYDSINSIKPKFDHYYQASTIGSNLGPGTYIGEKDNMSCATGDATDPVYAYTDCKKTLWYKFTVGVSGTLKYRMYKNKESFYYYDQIQLFRQVIPGDSTSAGLKIVNPSFGYDYSLGKYYGEACVAPGTYYMILPGCNTLTDEVYPEITISEHKGDFCSAPLVVQIPGAGNTEGTVLVDCHTIGTDYGEFNTTLTCPAGATTTTYKTSWFRMDIGGADTLDVTTYLTENTNAAPAEIKYRLMNGDCSAMQERSCVQDAQTRDTYKCLAPGSYYIQVFTPVTTSYYGYQVTGTITLNLSAVKHADTCAPINNCLTNANFQSSFDCTKSQAVSFTNYSTYGSSITYEWDFGYNNQKSTAVSPKFVYPGLTTSKKYYITLTVKNTSCGGESIYRDSIVIPPRPNANLGNDTVLCNGGSLLLNAQSHEGSTYRWQDGTYNPTYTASQPGRATYFVEVLYQGCYAWDTINVAINSITAVKRNNYICGGDPLVLNASRGLGESYVWNTGSNAASISVNTPGVYWADVSLYGCVKRDSFIVSNAASPLGIDRGACFASSPQFLNATTSGAVKYTWQDGSGGPNFSAPSSGIYWVDINFGSCTIRDSIQLSDLMPTRNSFAASFCSDGFYKLPSGKIVTTDGTRNDTLRSFSGCDSVIYTINLTEQKVKELPSSPVICSGQFYTLPWGVTVTSAGVYRDTLHYTTGCDSIRRIVNLIVLQPKLESKTATICQGQSYTLPWGELATTSNTYRDTLKYVNTGCDSVWREVVLTVQAPSMDSSRHSICAGQAYSLPWGALATTSGIYRDTLKYSVTGCDSLYRVINLLVQDAKDILSTPVICAGQSFTLPWGAVVSSAGVYRDTLRYTTGCDSIRRIVTLTVLQPKLESKTATICQGQSYTLPWGALATSSNTYRDTLKYVNTGCDSVWREVVLTVQAPSLDSISETICAGQSYTLPWGALATTTGIYRDTLKYSITRCDSLYRVIKLLVQEAKEQPSAPVICSGESYTLPWGVTVSSGGVYRDTLRYTTGCDSIRRIVTLTVLQPKLESKTAIICQGQSYTLPWGALATSSNTYRDTLKYVNTGCDSVWREVVLTIQAPSMDSSRHSICYGQSYTLPWGALATTNGIYRDTLKYSVTGCDSLYRVINLLVQEAKDIPSSPVICAGQSFTLPWGVTVSSAGVYRDTLRYTTGCDSIRRIVNLTVLQPKLESKTATICQGQSYTLPWGALVTSSNTYRDTLKYVNKGCDSVWREVVLTVQAPADFKISRTICQGQTYTLPWGIVVSQSGIYKDTLRYAGSGCDSLRREVTLTVKSASVQLQTPVICQGQYFTLPWGLSVNKTGIYRDTLKYTVTGCDSIYRIIDLTVKPAQIFTLNPVICSDSSFKLPWGPLVNTPGTYKDTIRTKEGCDSLVRTVNLTVNPTPPLIVTKSNDVNCILGTARLGATSGYSYQWSPTVSLDNPVSRTPLATPSSSTMYQLKVTANNGCTAIDSILVQVSTAPSDNDFPVPNAFTPNGDGKNDCFGISRWGFVSNLKFSIFNRWGEQVFSTTNPNDCWDGRVNGSIQATGGYVYVITALTNCGRVERKGMVVLVR